MIADPTTVAPRSARRRVTRHVARRAASAANLDAALTPVGRAVVGSAQARAEAARAAAAAAAAAVVDASASEVERLLAQARSEGEEAAQRVGAAQLIAARREALAMVLDARRRAFEQLRSEVVRALVEQANTPEVTQLAERLATAVRERVGASATVRRTGPGALTAVAELGSRRAVLGPDELIDRVLASMADGIAALWS